MGAFPACGSKSGVLLMQTKNGHITSLDGVRGIAILLVIVFHAGLGNYGWIGVQLFFVLSGFLITGILWKEKQAMTSLGYKFRKFWTRRALRIFPLYFGYLAALGVLFVLFHFPPYYGKFIAWLATYSFNYARTMPSWQDNPLFTQLWSLCVEEQFYIFFPLVIFLCPIRFTKSLMVTVIVLAPLIRYGLGLWYLHRGYSIAVAGDALYRNTLSHLDAFFLGGIIPLLSLNQRIKRPAGVALGALVLVAGAGALNYAYSPHKFAYIFELGYPQFSMGNDMHVWGYTLINLFFAACLLLIVSFHRPAFMTGVSKALSSRWLVRIGTVSYGMYVFNLAVWMYTFERWTHGRASIPVLLALFIPYLLVVYGLAELSYNFFELKFIRLKDRWFRGTPGGAAEVSASVAGGADGATSGGAASGAGGATGTVAYSSFKSQDQV